jgi:hypothetical protein
MSATRYPHPPLRGTLSRERERDGVRAAPRAKGPPVSAKGRS